MDKFTEEKGYNKKYLIVINVLLLLILSGTSCFLFYRQFNTDGESYFSDLIPHVKAALDDGAYTLIYSLYRFVWKIYPSGISIAFLLTVIVVLTVMAVAVFISKIVGGGIDRHVILAVGLVFLSCLYIPVLYPYFYVRGVIVTQPWHNCTYLIMRLMGLLVLAQYFTMRKNYLNHISLRDMVIFTVLLIFVNYAKPNFIIAFAPAMLIFLIADFIKYKWEKVWQIVAFGTCVLLSCLLLLHSLHLYFPKEGDSGVTITMEVFQEFVVSKEFFPRLIAELLFPLIVLVFAILLKEKNDMMIHAWVMYAIAWWERTFIMETGPRKMYGNFGWGILFFAFFLFMISISQWILWYKEDKISKRTYCCGMVVLALHVICGFVYYGYLLAGYFYLI